MGIEKKGIQEKFATLCGKRDFADVIKVKDLEMGEGPGLFR